MNKVFFKVAAVSLCAFGAVNSAWADCEVLRTFPADGADDVPNGLRAIWWRVAGCDVISATLQNEDGETVDIAVNGLRGTIPWSSENQKRTVQLNLQSLGEIQPAHTFSFSTVESTVDEVRPTMDIRDLTFAPGFVDNRKQFTGVAEVRSENPYDVVSIAIGGTPHDWRPIEPGAAEYVLTTSAVERPYPKCAYFKLTRPGLQNLGTQKVCRSGCRSLPSSGHPILPLLGFGVALTLLRRRGESPCA